MNNFWYGFWIGGNFFMAILQAADGDWFFVLLNGGVTAYLAYQFVRSEGALP